MVKQELITRYLQEVLGYQIARVMVHPVPGFVCVMARTGDDKSSLMYLRIPRKDLAGYHSIFKYDPPDNWVHVGDIPAKDLKEGK